MHKKLAPAVLGLLLIAGGSVLYLRSVPYDAGTGHQPPRESAATVDVPSENPEPPPDEVPGTGSQDQTGEEPPKVVAYAREKRLGDSVVDEHGVAHPLKEYKTLATPNDPNANQWWVSVVGAESGWDLGAGTEQMTLAVIDTGFALAHEEFAGRLHTNSGESGIAASENPSILNCTDRSLVLDEACNVIDDDFDGVIDNESGATTFENTSLLNCTDQSLPLDKSCNLIDDDGNGLTDDKTGFDFINYERSVQAGETNPDGPGTTHGTAVAGVAAATGNNNRGIAGVDWYSKILPIQAMDDDDYGNTISVGRSIRYAADQGADVINISLGTVGPDSFVRDAVAYAIAHGSIVVAAAGNEGCDCILYPAAYEEVVAVGASDPLDQRAGFSSYGATLDVVAPGSDMTSAYWTPTNQTSAYAAGLAGTSFSSPFTAGMLAHLKSHYPNASNHQLIGLLTGQTDRLSLTSSQPRSDALGYGRVSIASMVSRATTPPQPEQRYAFAPVSSGRKLGNYEPAGNVQVHWCEGSRPGNILVYRLSNGDNLLYTISHVERYKAMAAGYTSTTLGGSYCINMPNDAPRHVRLLSIAGELENRPAVKF